MRLLVLFPLLGGCQYLFNLQHVPDRTDGGAGDASDARIDASSVVCPIKPVVYDEDGDSIDDRCDACPTIASDALDDDGDGLPNACDPRSSVFGDVILFAATFAQATDLDAFDQAAGPAWSATDHGTVNLPPSSVLRTMDPYAATRIELRVNGMTGPGGIVALGTPSVFCTAQASDCAGTAGVGLCARLPPSTGESGIAGLPATLSDLRLDEVQGTTTCTVRASSTPNGVVATIVLGIGNVSITTDAVATTVVRSLVVYGQQ